MSLNRRVAISSILTLAIGYLPSYLHLILPVISLTPSGLTTHGNLNDYKIGACNGATQSSGACTKAYLLPKNLLAKLKENDTISFGLILRSVGVKCAGESSYFHTYGSILEPGSDRTESNKVRTIPSNLITCRDGLELDAWAERNDTRSGWISGPLISGDAPLVQKYKLLIDFYLNDVRLLISALLLTLYLLLHIFQRTLGTHYVRNGFEEVIGALAILNFINSGFALFLFPILKPFYLNGFSIFISTLIPLLVMQTNRTFRVPFFTFALLSLLISLSPFQSEWRTFTFVGLTSLAVLYSAIKTEVISFVFSIFCCLAAYKTIGFSWAPHPHVHSIFALLVVAWDFFRKIRNVLFSTAKLLTTMTYSVDREEQSELETILRFISTEVGDARVSIFLTSEGLSCEYYSFTEKMGLEQKRLDSLPPVIAHTVSTRIPKFHLSTDSIEFKTIVGSRTSSASNNYTGTLITTYPFQVSPSAIAVLVITDYSDRIQRQHSLALEFEQVIRMLAPTLASLIASICDKDRRNVIDAINSFKCALVTNIDNQDDIFDLLSISLQKYFNSKLILFRLETSTEELIIKSLSGYSIVAKSYLENTPFYAKSDNLQGPNSLAINTMTPVAVEDVHWLKGVVKEKTFEHFIINDTRSCLSLPIRVAGRPWGVIWMESEKNSYFRGDLRIEYKDLMETVSLHLESHLNLLESSRLKRRLGQFVPARALEKITKDIDPNEVDSGYLLMLDIKGSTALSLEVGTEQYKLLITSLADQLKINLGDWELQDIRWDAFFFTLSESDRSPPITKKYLEDFQNRIYRGLQDWKNLHPSKHHLLSGLTLRACLTRGDISRGIVNGKTNHWTITGSAMAVVHKIESAVKNTDGEFYIDLKAIALPASEYTVKQIIISGVEYKIGIIYGRNILAA